jgi:hypothetical protein
MRRFTRDVARCGRCPNFTDLPTEMHHALGMPRCSEMDGRPTSPIGDVPDWCPLPKVKEKRKP